MVTWFLGGLLVAAATRRELPVRRPPGPACPVEAATRRPGAAAVLRPLAAVRPVALFAAWSRATTFSSVTLPPRLPPVVFPAAFLAIVTAAAPVGVVFLPRVGASPDDLVAWLSVTVLVTRAVLPAEGLAIAVFFIDLPGTTRLVPFGSPLATTALEVVLARAPLLAPIPATADLAVVDPVVLVFFGALPSPDSTAAACFAGLPVAVRADTTRTGLLAATVRPAGFFATAASTEVRPPTRCAPTFPVFETVPIPETAPPLEVVPALETPSAFVAVAPLPPADSRIAAARLPVTPTFLPVGALAATGSEAVRWADGRRTACLAVVAPSAGVLAVRDVLAAPAVRAVLAVLAVPAVRAVLAVLAAPAVRGVLAVLAAPAVRGVLAFGDAGVAVSGRVFPVAGSAARGLTAGPAFSRAPLASAAGPFTAGVTFTVTAPAPTERAATAAPAFPVLAMPVLVERGAAVVPAAVLFCLPVGTGITRPLSRLSRLTPGDDFEVFTMAVSRAEPALRGLTMAAPVTSALRPAVGPPAVCPPPTESALAAGTAADFRAATGTTAIFFPAVGFTGCFPTASLPATGFGVCLPATVLPAGDSAAVGLTVADFPAAGLGTSDWADDRLVADLAATGLPTTGLATSGLVTTGLTVSGLAVTDLAVADLAADGLAADDLAADDLAADDLAIAGLGACLPTADPPALLPVGTAFGFAVAGLLDRFGAEPAVRGAGALAVFPRLPAVFLAGVRSAPRSVAVFLATGPVAVFFVVARLLIVPGREATGTAGLVAGFAAGAFAAPGRVPVGAAAVGGAEAVARVPVPDGVVLGRGPVPEAAGLVEAFLAAGIEVFLLANG